MLYSMEASKIRKVIIFVLTNLLSNTMSQRRDGARSYDEDTSQEHEEPTEGWSLTSSKITERQERRR